MFLITVTICKLELVSVVASGEGFLRWRYTATPLLQIDAAWSAQPGSS